MNRDPESVGWERLFPTRSYMKHDHMLLHETHRPSCLFPGWLVALSGKTLSPQASTHPGSPPTASFPSPFPPSGSSLGGLCCPSNVLRSLAPQSLLYLNSNPHHSLDVRPPGALRSRCELIRAGYKPCHPHKEPGTDPQGQTLLMRPEICQVPGSFLGSAGNLTDSWRGLCTSLAQQFWGP